MSIPWQLYTKHDIVYCAETTKRDELDLQADLMTLAGPHDTGKYHLLAETGTIVPQVGTPSPSQDVSEFVRFTMVVLDHMSV